MPARLPVILPADEAGAEDPDELLDLLDGLMLAGGADLDPASYGAVPDPRTSGFKAERDRFELALTRSGARARDPGARNLPGDADTERRAAAAPSTSISPTPSCTCTRRGVFADHEVRLEPGSLAAQAVGTERAAVQLAPPSGRRRARRWRDRQRLGRARRRRSRRSSCPSTRSRSASSGTPRSSVAARWSQRLRAPRERRR